MDIQDKMKAVLKIKKLGYSIRQSWILLHCVQWEFIYADDIARYGFSKNIIRFLVKSGHLDKHEADRYDDLCYDLSDSAHKRITEALNNG